MTKTYGKLQRTNYRDPKSYFSVCFSKGSMTFLLVQCSYKEERMSQGQFSMFLWDKMHLKNQSIEDRSVLHMFCFQDFNQAVNEQSHNMINDHFPIFLQSKKGPLINLLKF